MRNDEPRARRLPWEVPGARTREHAAIMQSAIAAANDFDMAFFEPRPFAYATASSSPFRMLSTALLTIVALRDLKQ